MGLEDLTDDELVTMAGLMREVINADGEYSDAERAHVDALAAALGEERFETVFTRARQELTALVDVKDHAKTVTRPEARRAIFDYLMGLAAADHVDGVEEKPLRWLVSWWDLGS